MRAAAATLGRLPRAVVVLPRTLRLSPRGRRRLLLLAVLALVLAGAYQFWLRDSSLVQVEKVTVTGLDSAEEAAVRAKLMVVARNMTTLHVNEDALRRAVANEPIVHSLSVEPDFPHGLRIHIVQNRPVALLVAGGRQVAVAPDGTVLDAVKVSGGALPTIDVGSLPGTMRMPDGPARQRVAVAAAAPARLLAKIGSISVQHGRGVVAELEDGPVVIFGGAVDLDQKWAAATAVLAQRTSQGAAYIDVRMPERPVAGGLDLEQDPQAQPESAGPGSVPGSPGVVPAIPPTDSAAAGSTTGQATTALPGTTPDAAATSPATIGSAPDTTAQATPSTPGAGATSAAPTAASTPSTESQP